MRLPEQYKNLDIDKKRIIVNNLISQFWNEKTQKMVKDFREEQVEFLFEYFFTDSKEDREKMWNDMQKRYISVLKELEQISNKLQNVNLQLSELLARREDYISFGKK